MKNSWIFGLVLSFLLYVSLASAYTSYYSPEYVLNIFLENMWIRFGLVFVVFYVIVFFGAQKAFREQRAVSVVLAFVISLLMSYWMLQRGWLNFDMFFYSSGGFGSLYYSLVYDGWLAVIGFLIVGIVLMWFIAKKGTEGWIITTLILYWLLVTWMYRFNYGLLSYLSGTPQLIFELFTGPIGIFLIVVVCAIVWFNRPHHDIRVRNT